MKVGKAARVALGPVALSIALTLGGCGVFKGSPKKTPTVGNRVSILASENRAEIDPSLASVQVLLPTPEVNTDWSQSGGSADKSMGHLALAASPTRAWTAQIDGGSNRQRLGAAPVVAENKLFVVDVDATLHAFAADTGAKLWTAAVPEGDNNRAARFGGGASYDDGKVYATDGLGDVVAFNAADGKQLWRAKPGGPLRGAPTLANGQVYVLSQDNQIFALDQADGKVVWTQSASLETQGLFGVAAPAASSGTIVAGFSSGELNAYRYENGRNLWQDALSRSSMTMSVSSLADINADAVIENGRVYAIGEGGRMVSLDLGTGQFAVGAQHVVAGFFAEHARFGQGGVFQQHVVHRADREGVAFAHALAGDEAVGRHDHFGVRGQRPVDRDRRDGRDRQRRGGHGRDGLNRRFDRESRADDERCRKRGCDDFLH